jgi:hypothetical protein
MLTKKTKTIEIETYFFNGQGPYDTEMEAVEVSLSKHLYYNDRLSIEDFLNDKELLIWLGEWAKKAVD